jgi:hypothetical protein
MSVKVIMSKKREERKRLACLNTGTFAIDEGVALFASKDLALAVSACRSAESDTGEAGAVGSDGGDAGNDVCVTVGATTTALELRSSVDALQVSIDSARHCRESTYFESVLASDRRVLVDETCLETGGAETKSLLLAGLKVPLPRGPGSDGEDTVKVDLVTVAGPGANT